MVDVHCPKCGCTKLGIDILASATIQFHEGEGIMDGTVDYTDGYDWGRESMTVCTQCNYTDMLINFENDKPFAPPAEPPVPPTMEEMTAALQKVCRDVVEMGFLSKNYLQSELKTLARAKGKSTFGFDWQDALDD